MMKSLAVLLSVIVLFGCVPASQTDKNTLFVSILPQKYFLERIVQDDYNVQVLVRPGHSPATYEPLPRQMNDLSGAELFFRIGVPFEHAWLRKIEALNPQLKIIDTRKNIVLREIEDAKAIFGSRHQHDNGHHHHHHDLDPHIWLSPSLVKTQAQTMYDAVVELNPKRKQFYKQNLLEFFNDLDVLQKEFKQTFSTIEKKTFMVFHPVWGYLADEFGLTQIPIELRGKKPSSQELAAVIDFAKKEEINVIFVQKQFSTQEAKAVAQAIEGKVIQIDPLAEHYLDNMRVILSVFREQLQ